MSDAALDATAEAVARQTLRRLPPDRPRTRADVAGLPGPLAGLLGARLDARAAEAAAPPAAPWFDADALGGAAEAWRSALRDAARFPADAWAEAVEDAARWALRHLVRPAETLAAWAFQDETGKLPAAVALGRARAFGPYPYLYTIAERYVERKGLEEVGRVELEGIFRRIDRRMASTFGADDWATLLGPLFSLAGPVGEPPGTVPPSLLRPLLRAKGADGLADVLPDEPVALDALRRLAADEPEPTAPHPDAEEPAVETLTTEEPPVEPLAAPASEAAEPEPAAVPEEAEAVELEPEAEPPEAEHAETPPEADARESGDEEPETPEADLPPPPEEGRGGGRESGTTGPSAPRQGEETPHPVLDSLSETEASRDGVDEPEAEEPEAEEPEADWDLPGSPLPVEAPAPERPLSPAHQTGRRADRSPPRPSHHASAGDASVAERPRPAAEPSPPVVEAARPDDERPEPDAPRPAPPAPDLTEPDLTEPDLVEPDLVEPDLVEPDLAEPDLTEPDVAPLDLTEHDDAADPAPAAHSAAPVSTGPEADEEPLWLRLARQRGAAEEAPRDPEGEEAPLWMRFVSAEDAHAAGPAERPAPLADAAPTSLDALERRVLGEGAAESRGWYVEELFGGQEGDYRRTLGALDGVRSWTEATEVIARDVFRRHRVNIYSEAAVAFTDAVEARVSGRP